MLDPALQTALDEGGYACLEELQSDMQQAEAFLTMKFKGKAFVTLQQTVMRYKTLLQASVYSMSLACKHNCDISLFVHVVYCWIFPYYTYLVWLYPHRSNEVI